MNNRNSGNGKTGLIILSVICIALIAVSFISSSAMTPLTAATGFVISPIQKGMNSLGSFLSGFSANMTDSATLREENQVLREKVDTLTAENSKLVLDKEELERLQELLDLKEEYSEYDSVGARVISKGSGNWFNTFTTTAIGPAMISTTSDTCIIAGNLALIDEGTLSLVKLTDDNNHVHVGDKVVTSNISEKYLPGILIGYISELNNDANNLTKSGTVTPVVDFRHLQEVLVIRTLKQYVVSDGEVAPTLPAVPGNQTILTAPRGQEAGAEVQTEGDAGTGTDENPDAGAEADGAGDAGNGEEGAADAGNGGEGTAQ